MCDHYKKMMDNNVITPASPPTFRGQTTPQQHNYKPDYVQPSPPATNRYQPGTTNVKHPPPTQYQPGSPNQSPPQPMSFNPSSNTPASPPLNQYRSDIPPSTPNRYQPPAVQFPPRPNDNLEPPSPNQPNQNLLPPDSHQPSQSLVPPPPTSKIEPPHSIQYQPKPSGQPFEPGRTTSATPTSNQSNQPPPPKNCKKSQIPTAHYQCEVESPLPPQTPPQQHQFKSPPAQDTPLPGNYPPPTQYTTPSQVSSTPLYPYQSDPYSPELTKCHPSNPQSLTDVQCHPKQPLPSQAPSQPSQNTNQPVPRTPAGASPSSAFMEQSNSAPPQSANCHPSHPQSLSDNKCQTPQPRTPIPSPIIPASSSSNVPKKPVFYETPGHADPSPQVISTDPSFQYLDDCIKKRSSVPYTTWCKNRAIPSSIFIAEKFQLNGVHYWCFNFEPEQTNQKEQVLTIKSKDQYKLFSWVRISLCNKKINVLQYFLFF